MGKSLLQKKGGKAGSRGSMAEGVSKALGMNGVVEESGEQDGSELRTIVSLAARTMIQSADPREDPSPRHSRPRSQGSRAAWFRGLASKRSPGRRGSQAREARLGKPD